MVRHLLFLGLLFLATGCVSQPSATTKTRPVAASPQVLGDTRLTEDTHWQGSLVIDGTVHLSKGQTLTIAPGTDIAFVRRDSDQDGLGDASLVIDGELSAVGTPDAPIRFRSAEAEPRPGDWLEIHVNFSPRIELRFCDIRHSAHGLHAHFTQGVVEDCTLAENIDGTRLGRAQFTLRNNLIEHNIGKGINFRDSRVEIHHNILRHNRVGIFLFEKDQNSLIRDNNFYDNDLHLRLGDFFTGSLKTRDNWWQGADAEEAAFLIHDRGEDPSIGTVSAAPVTDWVPRAGPRDAVTLSLLWRHETQGFVDASPQGRDDMLYVASWDGSLRALGPAGDLRWERQFEDVIDATPVLHAERLFGQSWGRRVFALDRADGDLLWQWSYPQSAADDHRQGTLVATDELILVPAWNGTLYALSQDSGVLRWSLEVGAALRAAPVLMEDALWIADTRGKVVKADLDGKILLERSLNAAVLAPPAMSAEGPVFVTRDGAVHALDHAGNVRWHRKLNEPCFYAAPVLSGGSVLVATAGGSLWKIDAGDGSVLWRAALTGPAYATPEVYQRRIYTGDNAGALQVFNLDSGTELAQYMISGAIQGGPEIWRERLVVGARDGAVHVFELLPSRPADE